MIALTFRTADDTADLPTLAGTLPAGGTLVQQGIIKNTGDTPITTLKMWLSNDPAYPLTCAASVRGVALPDVQGVAAGAVPVQAVQVLSAPLQPGQSVPMTLTWTGQVGQPFAGLDSCAVRGVAE